MPQPTWIEKLLQTNSRINLGEAAVMLDDRNRLLKYQRQSVAAAQRKFLGNDMPAPEPDEDDMGVHVGDTHNYPPPSQPGRPGMNPLLAGLLGAGLLAGAVGFPAGAWFLADAIRNTKTPAAPATPAGDGNTKYKLRLVP